MTHASMKVISLGWGVQSWTMAAMVALGELEPVDFAVYADTMAEKETTNDFAKHWKPWLEKRGVQIRTTKNAGKLTVNNYGGVYIPAYTVDAQGKLGQLRRQCTNEWKVAPVRRELARELDLRGLSKSLGIVELWLGITQDEQHRAKEARQKYIKHRFPFLEMNMTRADCLRWLSSYSLPSPGKSSCVFCPYQSRSSWEQMKRENGHDWKQACAVDANIRDKRPPQPLFVHPGRKPLEEAVVIPEDFGATQPELFTEETKEIVRQERLTA